MKRTLTVTLAVIGALVLAAALAPWAVSSRLLRDEIIRQIARATGAAAVAEGEATFALLPYPRIKLENVRLGSAADGLALDIPILRGEVRLLPLIAGRLELADLSLADPILRLGPRWTDGAGLSAQLGRAADLLFATPAARGRISQIAVTRGRVEQVSPDGVTIVSVSDIEGRLAASKAPAAAELTGEFRWRGMEVELTASGLDPAEYGKSRQTPVRLAIASPLLAAHVQGALSGPDLQFDGDLDARSPDLVALGGWLGFDPPLTSAGAVDISGNARLAADSLSLSGARIAIDGQPLDGTLLARLDEGKLTVSGTLATGRLDLTALKNALLPARAADGGWSREPFDLWRLPRVDFDLRLSVGSLVFGKLTLDNAALAVLSRAGKLDLSLAGADFLKGALKGKLALGIGDHGAVESKLSASLDRADAGLALGLLVDGRRLAGTGSGAIQIEGAGDSMNALMHSWNGKATLAVKQGELVGVNLPEALQRVERRPLVAGLDLIGGRTPFETASAAFKIADGVARLKDAQIHSPAARISLSGMIAIGERAYDLTGVVTGASGAAGKDAATLPFVIEGGFDQPRLLPDAHDLIRRSGAAAPFLQDERKDAPGWNALAPVETAPP